MSNQSHMVVATKYRLKEMKSQKDGTWNLKGSKEDLGTKILKRSFVEDRNSHQNNELYVVDEKKTEEMLELREANIEAKKNGTKVIPAVKEPVVETITHVLTKEDLKKNPALEENGLSEGDEVQLDEEGNVLIKS